MLSFSAPHPKKERKVFVRFLCIENPVNVAALLAIEKVRDDS